MLLTIISIAVAITLVAFLTSEDEPPSPYYWKNDVRRI